MDPEQYNIMDFAMSYYDNITSKVALANVLYIVRS